MNLTEFIESNERNKWIKEPGLSYYVRKSLGYHGLIELSNCSAPPTSKQFGYWRFLKKYESNVPFIAEQVINDGLVRLYRQRKWAEREICGIPQFASPLAVSLFGDNARFSLEYGTAQLTSPNQ